MKILEIGIGRMFFIKLEPNDDLFNSLTEAVSVHSIQTGVFTMIGALKMANFGYYLEHQKKYKTFAMNAPLEIVSCSGNVALKDGTPMIHAHLIVSDQEGRAFGGHLLPGNIISVTGEIFLIEARTPLIRKLDKQTQLSLIHLD